MYMKLIRKFCDHPGYAADWKLILDTFLKPVGGLYLLNYNFDLEDLCIVLTV